MAGIMLPMVQAQPASEGYYSYGPLEVNAAPVLSKIETSDLLYTKGMGKIKITGTLVVFDADTWIISASVQFKSGYNPDEDVLSFKGTREIKGSWDKTNGILTLSGLTTYTRYQSALRTVLYENTNVINPSTTTRVVTFTVSDGTSVSNTVSRNIVILSPDASPVLSNMETSPVEYCSGSGAEVITTTLSIADPDNLTLVSAKIRITGGYVQDEDFLRFSDQNGITGAWDKTSGILLLTGESGLANYREALRSVRYENTNPLNPVTGNHEISFSVNDGKAESNIVSRTVTVHDRVSAVLSGSTSVCSENITSVPVTVDFTGTAPWTFTLLKDDQTGDTHTGVNADPYTFNVKQTGTYRIKSLEDAYCQGDTAGSGYVRISAKPAPTAVISGNDTICPGDTAALRVALSGTPPWSITYRYNGANQPVIDNIRNNNYLLKVLAAGTYTLVKVSDAICTGQVSGTATVTQHLLPAALLSGDTTICESTPATLKVVMTGSAPWRFSYRLNSEPAVLIQKITASPLLFTVGRAGSYKPVEVSDKYCHGTVSGSALVNFIAAPDVTISGLKAVYSKQSAEWIPIIGTPSGGDFSGPGVIPYNTLWYFIPALPPLGNNNIVYRYRTSPGSCYGYDTAVVRILETSAEIEIENDRTKYCMNDKPFTVTGINLIDNSIGSFTISGNRGLVDHHDNTATVFPSMLNINQYIITYTGSDSTSVSKTVDIGVKPTADFEWESECLDPGQSYLINNTSVSSFGYLTDSSFSWKIQINGATLRDSTRDIVLHLQEPGNYSIELTVENSYGCLDTVTRIFPLRPTIQLAGTNYFETFESAPSDWQSNNSSPTHNNSWILGTPAKHGSPPHGFSGTFSGGNCWYTNIITNPAPQEQSWVSSPCFDFRGTRKPMLIVEVWRLFTDNRDGANLQVSSDSGKSWIPLGVLNDGINWFTDYYGIPGAQSMGWTATKDAGWVEARHSLDILKNQPRVQFRIAYSAIGSAIGNDGIAFDDVRIIERSRTAIVEHFTNSSDASCLRADAELDSVAQIYSSNMIDLQYHTQSPQNDPFYEDNPTVPVTRQFYYGIAAAPYAVIDGGTENRHRSDYSLNNPFDPRELIIESLNDSYFGIKLKSHIADKLYTHIVLKAFRPLPLTEISLRVAVTEEKINGITGQNGDTLFRNVVKALLPGPAGTTLYRSWNPGDSATVDLEWNLSHIYNMNELRVAAFIQNESTRYVYQAALDSIGVITGTDNPVYNGSENSFRIFPNPAKNRATLAFTGESQDVINLQIFNNLGKLVYSRVIPQGTLSQELPVSDLPEGLYLIRLTGSNTMPESGKLIISRQGN